MNYNYNINKIEDAHVCEPLNQSIPDSPNKVYNVFEKRINFFMKDCLYYIQHEYSLVSEIEGFSNEEISKTGQVIEVFMKNGQSHYILVYLDKFEHYFNIINGY